MEWLFALCAGALAMAGVYLILARHLMSLIVGVTLLGSAANLVVFAGGRLTVEAPPLVAEGQYVPEAAIANPLPQALVLTAIVIGFGLAAFALSLALATFGRTQTADPEALRYAEPEVRS